MPTSVPTTTAMPVPVTSVDHAATSRHRAPAPVWLAAALLTVMPLVSSAGAVYFTFVHDGGTSLAAGLPFVAVFFAISATAVAAAVGVVRGIRVAWRAAIGYVVAMSLWTVAKLVFWQEEEALVFGVVAIGIGLLLATPAARRHVTEPTSVAT